MAQFFVPIKALSINKAFQGRRFKTMECKRYELDLWRLLPRNIEMVRGEVEMTLEFYLKNYKMTDVSNLVKILEDILVKKGCVEDDRKIVSLHLHKFPANIDGIRITINKKTA